MTSYDAGLTNGGPPGSRETDVVVLGLRSARRHLSRPGRRPGAQHARAGRARGRAVQRLREMICAYPAFHRAVGSALDDLAGRDGPYS